MTVAVQWLHREPWLPGAATLRFLLTAALLLTGRGDVSGQQHMRGRLLDVDSNQPIAAGYLQLLALDSTVVASTMSDAQGNWRLVVPRPGRYFVAARHPGYQPWTSAAVDVAAGDQLNAVFHIKRLAVRLDPIEVRAEAVRQYLEVSGFFERQRGNFGHFMTPEAIEKRQASRVTDLLTAIPGVQRVALTGGSVGPAHIQLRGSSLSQGGLCRPRIFVDGLMYSTGDSRPIRRTDADATERADEDLLRRMDQAISLDDLGHPSIIAGIEVYRSASQVPVQFGGTSVDTLCGVIVIWTHTGRMRAGERS